MPTAPFVISRPTADRQQRVHPERPGLERAAVDELVRRAVAAGAAMVTEPGPQPWGYAGTFTDPDGHLWMATSAP